MLARIRNHAVRALVIAGLVVLPLAAAGTPAQAANKGDEIGRGERLNKGDYLTKQSTAGYSIQLIMQGDGNLVLKRTSGTVCWATGTNPSGHHAIYQRDGNFVVYNSSGRALWASNTVGATWETGQTVSVNAQGKLYVGYKFIYDC